MQEIHISSQKLHPAHCHLPVLGTPLLEYAYNVRFVVYRETLILPVNNCEKLSKIVFSRTLYKYVDMRSEKIH